MQRAVVSSGKPFRLCASRGHAAPFLSFTESSTLFRAGSAPFLCSSSTTTISSPTSFPAHPLVQQRADYSRKRPAGKLGVARKEFRQRRHEIWHEKVSKRVAENQRTLRFLEEAALPDQEGEEEEEEESNNEPEIPPEDLRDPVELQLKKGRQSRRWKQHVVASGRLGLSLTGSGVYAAPASYSPPQPPSSASSTSS
ncbi:hypothetical protein QOT17_003184 [Balamuthia mandrillaris]